MNQEQHISSSGGCQCQLCIVQKNTLCSCIECDGYHSHSNMYKSRPCVKCSTMTIYSFSNNHDDPKQQTWCKPVCIQCYTPHWHQKSNSTTGDRYWFEIKARDGDRKLTADEMKHIYQAMKLSAKQIKQAFQLEKEQYQLQFPDQHTDSGKSFESFYKSLYF